MNACVDLLCIVSLFEHICDSMYIVGDAFMALTTARQQLFWISFTRQYTHEYGLPSWGENTAIAAVGGTVLFVAMVCITSGLNNCMRCVC